MSKTRSNNQPSSVRLLGWSAAFSLLCLSLSAPDDASAQGICTGHIGSKQLKEISGMVASRQNEGVLWMHNDSGHAAQLFAVTERGETIATYHVTGASARDWEDIALGPGPEAGRDYLYIGDIGDNGAKRPHVLLFRVPEPKIPARDRDAPALSRTATAQIIRLQYPDGPHDAETLILDPRTGDVYIITKRDFLSKVYRAATPHSTTESNLMERVALMPWGFAVAGDISPDGRSILVRGYSSASVFKRPDQGPLWQAFLEPSTVVPLQQEQQGEAICFNAQGSGYYTTSEGKHQPIYFYTYSSTPNPPPSP